MKQCSGRAQDISLYSLPWDVFTYMDGLFALPPIIMEVKNGPILKETMVLEGPILHFHDYGRKSKDDHFGSII